MRSKSIISIIRRYGLSSKRLDSKNRIRYSDAIRGIRGFENAQLRIDDVIDNQRFPNKSHSCVCQVPGCGMHIRHEYILKNKVDDSEIVAGSTCVWTLLGMSELEIKSFKGLEAAIKEYHALEDWKVENPDVVDKLSRMKSSGMGKYRPFWTEIEYSRLTEEDTKYIRSAPFDEELEKLSRSRSSVSNSVSPSTSKSSPVNDERVLRALDSLLKKYPNNSFYLSLKKWSDKGKEFTVNQERAIKLGFNKMWYYSTVKGTNNDCWPTCDGVVASRVKDLVMSGKVPMLAGESADRLSNLGEFIGRHVGEVTEYFKRNLSAEEYLAWSVYKVKNNIVE